MKINNYGIKITTINSCLQAYTIKVKFNFDMRIKQSLENSMFCNSYFFVIDKNGKENLILNYGTFIANDFIKACEEFEIISVNNKLNKITDNTKLSKRKLSKLLISKVMYEV